MPETIKGALSPYGQINAAISASLIPYLNWGNILGDMTSQADLQAALAGLISKNLAATLVEKIMLADPAQNGAALIQRLRNPQNGAYTDVLLPLPLADSDKAGIITSGDKNKLDAAASQEDLSALSGEVEQNLSALSATIGQNIADLAGSLGQSLTTLQQTANNALAIAQAVAAGALIYQGQVATVEALNNISSPRQGDMYDVLADGHNHAWNGANWDDLGGTVSLDGYATEDSVAALLQSYVTLTALTGGSIVAGKAAKLNTAQTVAITGAVTGSGSFDGSAALNLATIAAGGTPSTQLFGDAANIGTATTAAKSDHKHAMPAAPTTITGNAATATKLAAARTIALSGGATGTATNFDGSANITIPVTALDATKLSGTAAINITGSAAKLSAARTIALAGAVTGSASFDGSGNVSITTSGGGGYNFQLFTASGTFTVPAGVTKIKVTCIGGGGRISGNPVPGSVSFAALTVTPGGTKAVVIGAAQGSAAGGTTSFGSTDVVAAGGISSDNGSGAPQNIKWGNGASYGVYSNAGCVLVEW